MSQVSRLPKIQGTEKRVHSSKVPRLTLADKKELLQFKKKVMHESEAKREQNTKNKVWKRSVPADMSVSNFARILKNAIASYKEPEGKELDGEAVPIKDVKKNTFFSASQKNSIQTALEIVNVRKREKENASLNVQKRETIVESMNKTRDIFLLKTTAKIIEGESGRLDSTLAREKEAVAR